MKKRKKTKILIIIISCIAALAVCAALLFTVGPFGKGTSDVFLVSDLYGGGYYEEPSMSYGTVRAEGFQNVMVSETQSVTDVFVKKGQNVNKGDAILAYDSTLSDIELDRAKLEVDRLTLDLETAKKELAEINEMIPGSEKLIEPDNSWLKYDPVETPYVISGKGTKKDPMYLIVKESDEFNAAYFEKIMPENKKKIYAVFLNREHDAVNGKITGSFALVLRFDGESFSFQSFKPEIPDISMTCESVSLMDSSRVNGVLTYTEIFRKDLK